MPADCKEATGWQRPITTIPWTAEAADRECFVGDRHSFIISKRLKCPPLRTNLPYTREESRDE